MRTLRHIALSMASGLLTMIGLVIVAWLVLVPWAVESVLREELADQGIVADDFKVTRLWLDGATVRDVRLSVPRAEVARVRLDWTLDRLSDVGKVDRLAISGVRIPATIGQSGAVSIGDLGLAPLIERFSAEGAGGDGADEAGSPSTLPFDDLVIDDVAIRVDTYWRAFLIPADVDVSVLPDGSVRGGVAFTIDSEGQQLTAEMEGRWAPNGTVDAELTVSGSPLGYGDVALTDASGWITLSIDEAGEIALDGWIGAGDLQWQGRALGSVELLYQGSPLPELVFARLNDLAGNAMALDVTGDAGTGWRVDAALEADALEPLLTALPEGLGLPALSGSLVVTSNAELAPSALDGLLAGTMPTIDTVPLAISAQGLSWPGVVRNLDAQGQLDLAVRPGEIGLSSSQTLRLSGVVDAIDQQGEVEIGPVGDRWSLIVPSGPEPGFAFDGQVRVARPDGGTVTLAGMAAGDARGVDFAETLITGHDISFGDWQVGDMAVSVDGRAALTGIDLDIAGTIAGQGSVAGFAIEGGEVELGLRLTGPPLQPRLAASQDCQTLRFTRLDLDGVVLTPADGAPPPTWCFAMPPGDQAPQAQGLVDWRDGAIVLALDARSDSAVAVDIDGTRVTLDGPRVSGAGGLTDLAVALTAASARSADLGLALSELAAEGRTDVTGDWTITAAMTASGLVLDGRPVVPVDVAGDLSASAEALVIEGSASYRGLSFPISLSQDLAGEDGGWVTITVPGIRFRREGFQPSSLVPALALDAVDWVDGTVSGQVDLAWNGSFGSSASLRLNDVALGGPGFDAAGINGRVRLYSLDPPRLADGQELAVATLDVGLGLRDGTIVFGLGRGNTLSVQSARFQWAGGLVASEQFSYDLDGDAVDVVLTATGITLERLLQEFPVAGLTATGTLDGRIPISLRGDTIRVNDGRLATRAPGIIRYQPGGGGSLGGGGDLDLFYDAVENFHYDSVVVTLTGATGGDLTMGFEISGANPDLYDGYPIDLNINISGALDQILREGLEVMSIGDRAQDYFQNETTRESVEGFWGNR